MAASSILHWVIVLVIGLLIVGRLRAAGSGYRPDADSPFAGTSFRPARSYANDGEHGYFEGIRLPVIACVASFAILFFVAQSQFGSFDLFLGWVWRHAAMLMLVGAAQALVVLAGRIDLSVGGIGGLSAAVMAYIASSFGDGGVLPVVLGLGTGAACGLVNALLVTRTKMPAFLVTIATGQLMTGLAVAMIGNTGIGLNAFGADLLLIFSGDTGIAGISTGTVFALIVAMVLAAMLVRSEFGRRVYAAGEERDSDEHNGVRTMAYVASGLLCALAAWIFLGDQRFIYPYVFQSYMLESVAVVVLAGISIYGGFGSIAGVVLAALAVSSLLPITQALDLDPQVRNFLIPVLLLVGLLYSQRRSRDG